MKKNWAVLVAAMMAFVSVVHGPLIYEIDLMETGNVVYAAGAIFAQGAINAGSGTYVDMVGIQRTGTEQGYNTGNKSVAFDEQTGVHTRDVQLGQLPVNVLSNANGTPTEYVYFGLDIHESNNNPDRYLSIDKMSIYIASVGSLNYSNLADFGAPAWDMDAASNCVVIMDSSLSRGSGWSDSYVYIPSSVLHGKSTNDYIYFYSHMGGYTGVSHGVSIWRSEATAEQWALDQSAPLHYIPEPGSLAVMAPALLAGSVIARLMRRRKKQGVGGG